VLTWPSRRAFRWLHAWCGPLHRACVAGHEPAPSGHQLTVTLTVMCTAIVAVPAAPQSPPPAGRKMTLSNAVLRQVHQEITLQVANAVRRLHAQAKLGAGVRLNAINNELDCTASVLRTIEIKMIAIASISTRLRLLEIKLTCSTDGQLGDTL
jgi:hypothetical protein